MILRVIAESGKLKKTKVRCNLVGARNLEGLGTLGRLGLESFLLFMYPNFFFSGLLTAWRAVERFYAVGFVFLFNNTLLCCPRLHLSSLNLYRLIFVVDVILFGLDCFINSVLAYFHIPHIHCLIISLN